MKIIVDADACPKSVLQVCFKLGQVFDVSVWTVASFNHQVNSEHHVIVGNNPQEADIKVMNLCETQDIVVTQDWGLGAMVLGKGAFALTPGGREFRAETIEFMLEEREAKAKLRRAGGRTKGPNKRTAEDDRHFEAALKAILHRESQENPNR